MPACEKCWREFQRRRIHEPNLTYSMVVVESDQRGGCTPAEQCGEMHVVIDWKDGSRRCRCGLKQEPPCP